MQSRSKVIVASAGSGKTTWVVKDALQRAGRTAVVSYTINNTERVRDKFAELNHAVPERVTVMTWFGFLLRDLVRPYQNAFIDGRVPGLHFVNQRSARYAKKPLPAYFFDRQGCVYSDKISEFALLCNKRTGGLVFDRLKALYECIYIDEVQDLAGWDLELVEAAMKAGVRLRLVGDNRQATYATNPSSKNKAFRGPQIIQKFRAWNKAGLCELVNHAWSYRCSQAICDLADLLFPDCEASGSRSTWTSPHAGLYLVEERLVASYVNVHQPQVLVDSKRARTGGLLGLNFGDSKGLEFEHVVIFPTNPIRKWLKSADLAAIEAPTSRAKLYVAITRARHSVAFVYGGESALAGVKRITASDLP